MADLTFSLLSRTFPIDGSFAFDVLVTGNEFVNAVTANVTYNQEILSLIKVDYGLTMFPLEAVSVQEPGLIKITRAISRGSVMGTSIVATLHFKGIKAGEGIVGFAGDCMVIDFLSEANILNKKASAVFTITDLDTIPPAPIE